MNHRDITELLSAYANDEVTTTQREFVEQHLSTCNECRDTLAEFSWVKNKLASLKTAAIPNGIRGIDMTAFQFQTSSAGAKTGISILKPAVALLAIFALVVVLVVAQNLGDSDKSAIAKTYDAIANLQSYQLTGTTTGMQSGQAIETTFEWTFSGDHAAGTIGFGDTVSEFRLIGEDQYVRTTPAQDNSSVSIVTDSLLSPIPTSEGTLLGYLERYRNVRELPAETINGVENLHFTGDISIGDLWDAQLAGMDESSEEYAQAKIWADIQRQTEIKVELWIDDDNYWVQRMNVDVRSPIARSSGGKVEIAGWSTFTTNLDYSSFNEQVDITPPITPTGALEPGWIKIAGASPAPQTSTGK
ncbi:MAG: zf-HC2 domain-containing protein [Dehalococcoidia bacterium]